MANSYTVYNATAGTQTFAVPFPYLQQSDVSVFVNGIQMLSPKDYVWTSNGSIKLNGALIKAATVLLQRQTSPNSVLVTFADSATLTAEQLNEAVLQNFYRNQELSDQLDQYLTGGLAAYSVSGQTAGMTPQELINQIAAGVLNTTLATELQQSITDISNNAQSILTNTNSINTINGIINSLNSGGGIQTLITTEQNARIAGDSALQQQLTLIGAMNIGATAFILNQSTTYVDSATSLATYISGVSSSLGTANSQIASLQTSVTTLTNAGYQTSAQVATAIQSSVTSGAIATALSSYSTTAQMNTAISTSSSGLQSQINNNYAAYQATASTVATINGNLTTLSSQYLLRTDVNGNVVGFGIYNNGTVAGSQIVFNAPNFAIINGAAKTVPFSVSGGQVFMQSVVIQDAVIQNMNIGKLTQGSLNADMNVGTGHIIFDNGTVMLVQGAQGFGSTNQFIQWFGPHFASFSSCTEANAKFYLKVDGSAYFGGALTAGTLSNSVTGTIIGSGNTATLSGFGSNGGSIVLTCSWNAGGSLTIPPGGGNGAIGATVSGQFALQQSTNSGSTWTTVQTSPVLSSTVTGDPANSVDPGDEHAFIGGSFTFTDTAHTTALRYYRLIIVSDNLGTFEKTSSLTLTTVEQ